MNTLPVRLASAHGLEPAQRVSCQRALVGQGLKLTPVSSSAVPVRGVSRAPGLVSLRAFTLLGLAGR